MKEILWAIVAIGLITLSTDLVDWLADKIQDRFNK